MLKLFIFTAFFISYQNLCASDCHEHSPDAKFKCANTGDNYANSGDFENAIKEWTISCKTGLSSSCDSVQKYKTNPKKFINAWNADPSLVIIQKHEKQKSQIAECKNAESNLEKCISIAKEFLKKKQYDEGILILSSQCNLDRRDACFDLGGLYIRIEQNEKAISPYLKSCALGHTVSCTILGQVQANVKMKQEKDDRDIETQRQVYFEERRQQEQRDEKNQNAMRKIRSAFEPPKTTTCTTKKDFFGNSYITECQ